MTKIKWNISLAGSIEKAHGQVIVIEEELLRRTMDESDQLVSEMAAQNALTSSRAERQCTNHTRQPLCQHHPRCTAHIYEAIEKSMMKWRDSQIHPASPAPDATFSLDQAALPRPSSKQALAHVLIVDDNEINVKVLSQAASHIRFEHHLDKS
ncbi:CheY-like superfamily [Penicillium chrysogenum]|nr:CheY-like superfamily [Penicillium chrysogenum]